MSPEEKEQLAKHQHASMQPWHTAVKDNERAMYWFRKLENREFGRHVNDFSYLDEYLAAHHDLDRGQVIYMTMAQIGDILERDWKARNQMPAAEQPAATPHAPAPGATDTTPQASAEQSGICPNSDFTMVKWGDVDYRFSLGVQSSAVQALFEEWKKTGMGLHQQTIGQCIDTERDSFRMDTAFRGHPAFGMMIQSCGDGRYQLVPPGTQPIPPAKNAKKSARITRKSRRKRV